jgi:hypothetical protein
MAVTDTTKKFVQKLEVLISKEKNLRKLDHTFRILILIEALKIVKRMFWTQPEASPTTILRAK